MRRTIHAALIASLAITADAFVAPSPSLSLAFPPHAVKCSAVRGLDLNLRAASSSKEGVKDEKETRAAKYWAEAEKAFTDVAVRKAKENMKRGPPASGKYTGKRPDMDKLGDSCNDKTGMFDAKKSILCAVVEGKMPAAE